MMENTRLLEPRMSGKVMYEAKRQFDRYALSSLYEITASIVLIKKKNNRRSEES